MVGSLPSYDFLTELKEITFGEGDYKEPIVRTYEEYRRTHEEMYQGRDDKFICLMDLALMAMRKLKAEGKLDDQEESEEMNACSIVGSSGCRWRGRRVAD